MDGGGLAEADSACQVLRTPLTLQDGSHPYIEPEALLRVGSAFVVAGSPTYTWAATERGATNRLTAGAHVAARFDLEGRATLIDNPIGGGVGTVRAVPLGGDRWGILFDEVPPDSLSGPVSALWYAEHDGRDWTRVEQLPLPEEGMPRLSGSSDLVQGPDGLVWITPVGLAPIVVEYERRAGRWAYRHISEAEIEVSALAVDPETGLWWAHFSEDPDLPGWQQSLRVYRKEAGWQFVQRAAVLGEGMKVRNPTLTPSARGMTLSWRVESAGDLGAYALAGIGVHGPGTRVPLDPRVVGVMPIGSPDGDPSWVVAHLDEEIGSIDLRLVTRGSPFGPARLLALPSPYLAFQAALQVGSSEALIVGPEYSDDPRNSFLRSLILRLSTLCT